MLVGCRHVCAAWAATGGLLLVARLAAGARDVAHVGAAALAM
jgi:hypothetical protein